MGSTNRQISRFEITSVYSHPEAKVDIVLVHGLNGSPERTWTSTKTHTYWPADLLPDSLKDKPANILVYGYNADVFESPLSAKHNTGATSDFILTHAQNLVSCLTIYRKSERTSKNPIIWVAHSLGGILVKRALLYSNDVTAGKHEHLRSVYVSTYGIIFLGTPHQGSQVASWGHMLQSMAEVAAPKKLLYTEGVLLKTLKKDSEALRHINNHFLDIYQRFQIQMVREAQKTDLKGIKSLIVDAPSAGPELPDVTYYSIEATHSGMCKFAGKDSPGYRNVAASLLEWVSKATSTIQARWEVEVDDRRKRAFRDAQDRVQQFVDHHDQHQMGGDLVPIRQDAVANPSVGESPAAQVLDKKTPKLLDQGELVPSHDGHHENDPKPQDSNRSFGSDHSLGFPLVVRDGFRPNSFCKGRDDEIKQLHRILTDKRTRSEGTASALIHGMPGSGKTHLARQYVFDHLHDFPGGIFWVRAKSPKEAEDGFWKIARHEAFRTHHSADDIKELRDQKKMVKLVKRWLSSRHNWLLVLDGIHFEDHEMQAFIPFAENTSLIFTSTEKIIGNHHFNNPKLVDLPKLRVQQAQDLLLEEMGRKKPYTRGDLANASELVQLMENLPLMIHVAAQQLTATGEPLSHYVKAYKKGPKLGRLPAYRAVMRQLQDRGYTEALNLISILSFYRQEVPVEMLSFGLRALKETILPVKTRDLFSGVANLNTTFRVLISFGLLERNVEEEPASSQSSASRKSMDNLSSDGLDIVRLHSVVQAFFIDTMVEEKEKDVPFWLELAVAVYCHSYDEANLRMKGDPNAGLPDDYRSYRTHGETLLSHLIRFDKKYPTRLNGAREKLESRYNTITNEIEHLTETIFSSTTHVVSIFRSPSISDSDGTTPATQSATDEYFLGGDDHRPVVSPTRFDAVSYETAHDNVLQFHRPYPETHDFGYLMPSMPDDPTDDDMTATPAPPISERGGATPSVLSEAGDDDDGGWTQVTHRTVRRTTERRYRDRAGAWRQTAGDTKDPRVGGGNRPLTSISRYTALGTPANHDDAKQRSSRSPSFSTGRNENKGLQAISEAEEALARIYSTSPPRPHDAHAKSRSSSSGSAVRPSLASLGRNSYAKVAAQVYRGAQNSTSPIFAKLGPQGFAPLKNLGVSPSGQQASSLPGDGPSLDAIGNPHIQGGESNHSSPAQGISAWPPPGLPVQLHHTSALYNPSGVSLSSSNIRRLDNNSYRPPSIGRESTRSSTRLPNKLSHSVPAIPHTRVHPPGSTSPNSPTSIWAGPTHQTPYPPDVPVQGYTSQPMTRDTSHQSTHSEPAVSRGRDRQGRGGTSRSASRPPPPLLQEQSSSVVESEPSPRLQPLDAGAASHRLHRHKHGHGHQYHVNHRGQRDEIDIIGADMSAPEGVLAGFGGPDSGIFIPGRRDGSDRNHGRSGSGSGSRSRAGSRPGGRHRSPSVGVEGEEMARSISSGGGFAIGGRIIEFGEHSVDVGAAGERARVANERIDAATRGTGGAMGLGVLDGRVGVERE